MLRLGVFFTFIIFSRSLLALSVVPSPSIVTCGTTTITFTFDCAFTGSVLIPFTPSGVTQSGSSVKVVSNGVVTFDISVAPSAGSNFSLNFVVISSDMVATCAPINASVNASFTTSCVMPPNNDCANALPLSISTDACIPMAFSTTNTSSSGSIPSCGVAGYFDLFYTFNANNDTITMEIPGIPGTVGHYGLYDACPANGAELDCSIMISFTGSTYKFTNLIVGADYYLQLLFIPSTAGTDQEICLHSTTAQPVINCPTVTIVSDAGPNLPNQSYSTSQTISTSGPCVLGSTGIVFNAGTEIILGPGFSTGAFGFEAVIGGCTP